MKKEDIKRSVEYLKLGKLVCFPTETVYGLGADATNSAAILKIYKIKGRPSFNPLIIHTYSVESAEKIGIFNEDAKKLSILWPGPISLVMKQKGNFISENATNSLDSIAIRIPSDEIAREILKEFSGYIAAPSANPSGYISPTKFEHVYEHYKNNDEIHIVKGRDSICGIESTIVDLSSDEPSILRHGFIEQETIEKILGKKIKSVKSTNIIAPGMLDKHYSPYSKLRLNSTELLKGEIGIGFGRIKEGFLMNLSPNGSLKEAAFNLYDFLRRADKVAMQNKKTIAISPIPDLSLGIAINDKLSRAAKTY